MKFLIATIAGVGLYATAATAGTALTTQGLLDSICVGGKLNEATLGPFVKQTGDVLGMLVTQIPAESLPTLTANATSAWGLAGGDQMFIFAFAKATASDGTPSSSCSVASQVDNTAEIKAFIEERYQSEKVVDQKQGMSTMTVYKAKLLGFAGLRYFSVQTVHAEGIPAMVMVSFFDNAK